jgi:hypothetical protein
MPLAASGTISIGGSTATRSINLELGRAAGASSNLNETALRSLAGVASGAISLSNFYGKSSLSYVTTLGFNGQTYGDQDLDAGNAISYLQMFSDGTWRVTLQANTTQYDGNWATPTTAGVGAGKYVKFTLGTTDGSSSGTSWSTTTGWQELNATRQVSVGASTVTTGKYRIATYTVEVSTSASGSPVVASGTITLEAAASYTGGA